MVGVVVPVVGRSGRGIVGATGDRTAASLSTEVAKLRAADASSLDRFGHAVAVTAGVVLVGAPFDDDEGVDSGSVYVFTGSDGSWSQQTKLTAEDGEPVDRFGFSLAVSEDTAVVGAPFEDASDERLDAGAAYVFTGGDDSWSQQAKLAPLDRDARDGFGRAVAVDADTALVGAPFDDGEELTDAGSVYVYRRSSGAWGQEAKLTAEDGDSRHGFGESVAVSGDTAVVGAQFDDDNGFDAGAAYVFVRDEEEWRLETKLTAEDGGAADFFGSAVDVDGDTVLVGAVGDDDNGLQSGSAYVFTREEGVWMQAAKLTASDGELQDNFGGSVALSGDLALVGADGDDVDDVRGVGSAYRFARAEDGADASRRPDASRPWVQVDKLTPSDGGATDRFGRSVALAGDVGVVGSQFNNGDQPNSPDFGAVYVFTG
jgi:hypothetical protein